MLNDGIILMVISVSALISIFLVISIPKYLYMCEYANITIVLNKIENIVSIFSTVCLVFGFIIYWR